MLPAHFATSSRYILMIALLPAGCERDKAVDSPPPNGLSAEHTFLSDSSAARSRNPAPNPAALSDASINEAVLASLSRDPGVDASRISATTVNGIVELAGEARTLLTKRRAVRVAQSVKGVRVVDDRVELRLEQRPDEDLASDVSRALRQSSVTDNLRITAVAQRGVVTLAGQVRSYQELEIARRVAEGVRGVREVRNDLTFDYSSAKRDDTEIAADVRSRLRWDLLVDDGLIVVAVRDGKVRLTGNIASAAERDRAFADAWVVGTRQVDTSGLGVTWRARRLDLHRNKLLGTSDSEIRSALLAAAANDPRLARASLSVNVVQSVATLSGAVASLSAKLAAGGARPEHRWSLTGQERARRAARRDSQRRSAFGTRSRRIALGPGSRSAGHRSERTRRVRHAHRPCRHCLRASASHGRRSSDFGDPRLGQSASRVAWREPLRRPTLCRSIRPVLRGRSSRALADHAHRRRDRRHDSSAAAMEPLVG